MLINTGIDPYTATGRKITNNFDDIDRGIW